MRVIKSIPCQLKQNRHQRHKREYFLCPGPSLFLLRTMRDLLATLFLVLWAADPAAGWGCYRRGYDCTCEKLGCAQSSSVTVCLSETRKMTLFDTFRASTQNCHLPRPRPRLLHRPLRRPHHLLLHRLQGPRVPARVRLQVHPEADAAHADAPVSPDSTQSVPDGQTRLLPG